MLNINPRLCKHLNLFWDYFSASLWDENLFKDFEKKIIIFGNFNLG